MTAPRGFTLIELIIVVLIMSILASAAVPLARLHQRRIREGELDAALRTLRVAIDAYKQAWNDGRIERKPDDSGYPPDLNTLVDGVKDVTDPMGRRIYFLRRLPRDPFADRKLAAADTWSLRSYASPPTEPAPGKDVFDVSSFSTGVGLDGTPYNQR